MHKGILAARTQAAIEQIKQSITVLAERSGLEGELSQRVDRRHRDTAVSALFKLEAIAEVLDLVIGQNSLNMAQEGPEEAISLEEVLSVPGLSKTSLAALRKALEG